MEARGLRYAIGLAVASTLLVACSLFDWAKVTDAGDAAQDGGAWTCESITSDPSIKQKLPAIVPIDLPPNKHFVSVAATDDLQQKINAAQPGDVLELAPGAMYSGPFTLPPFSGAGWIVIRTATPDDQFAMPGTRVSPALAPKMAKLTASSTTAVLSMLNGAGGYRIIGLEIEGTTSLTVNLGGGGVHDVILDRVYAHGAGMVLQGQGVALIDSYASGASASYAITIGGNGPVRITNDALDSPENHVWIQQGSDVEICQNAMTFSGGSTSASIHMTNASTVLIGGNVIDTTGTVLSLTQGTQSDLTMAYNHTTRAGEYMYLDDPMTNVVVHDNLFDSSNSVDTQIRLFGSATNVKIDHNTFTKGTSQFLYFTWQGGPYGNNVVYTNNFTPIGQYGVHGSNDTGSVFGTAALDGDLGSYTFSYNAIWGDPSSVSNYPANNFFPAYEQDVGFATDWSLTSSSAYKAKASDGKDIGADIATLTAATMNVP